MNALHVLSGSATWSVDQGDALEWLRGLPADSVDLVFGSPPYEQARLYLEGGQNIGIARKTEAWVAWMVEVYREAVRVCRGLVAFVVEGQTRGFRYSAGPALLMADLCRAGFNLRKPPVFHRVGIPGSGGPDWLRNDWEWIICVTRPGKLPWSDSTAMGKAPRFGPGGDLSHRTTNGDRTRRDKRFMDRRERGVRAEIQSYAPPALANPGNVIRCKVGGGLMGHHLAHENEAPFPESLADWFTLSFCPPGGIVADCFAGSGTTLGSAVTNGRRVIGCDLRQSQVDLTTRRMADVQPSLLFAKDGHE